MHLSQVHIAKWAVLLLQVVLPAPGRAEDKDETARWLRPQNWRRDTDRPILRLGQKGEFDDQHIFAPLVAWEDNLYRLWYCGSRGEVAKRVFRLGLATSADGRQFSRHSHKPVYEFGDDKHSVLTPTLLRTPEGAVLREAGRLRMWFSTTWFEGGGGVHSLHETTSRDGVAWSSPSKRQLDNVYAPSILKTDRGYEMWYTDPSSKSWTIRHAVSQDGRKWRVTPTPALSVGQGWESQRLFYPTVLKVDGVYLMWYGSYWQARANTTALGFAISRDGKKWTRHPNNPVLRPDPKRAWESHYVTSQSVMRMKDGSFRIWYASRKKPPFVNKYFALNTAVWKP